MDIESGQPDLGKRAELLRGGWKKLEGTELDVFKKYSGGKQIQSDRAGMYHVPKGVQLLDQNRSPIGVQYSGYGLMPQAVHDVYGNVGVNEPNPVKRAALKRLWGGTLGPMPESVNATLSRQLDDQYANVIQAIEQTLGTRTDPAVWQGRITTQKAIWDAWIDYVRTEWIDVPYRGADVEVENTLSIIDLGEGPQSGQSKGIQLHWNLVEMSIYFKNNLSLDDNAKLYLCVEIEYPGDGMTKEKHAEKKNEIEQLHPAYKNKLIQYTKGAETRTFLKVRAFTKNTSELKWRLSPKYGPFDVLYGRVGTFKKTYIDAADFKLDNVPASGKLFQAQVIQEYIREGLANQLAEFLGSYKDGFKMLQGNFEFGDFYMMGSDTVLEQLVQKDVISSLNIKSLNSAEEYLIYLRANHTLAKWFYGKRSALQKINQDRINNYLERDKKGLKNVMQFFGGDGKFVDKRR